MEQSKSIFVIVQKPKEQNITANKHFLCFSTQKTASKKLCENDSKSIVKKLEKNNEQSNRPGTMEL